MTNEKNTDATMLYKKGTAIKVTGGTVDYIVVEAHEVDELCKGEWFKTSPEALEAKKELTKGEKMAITKAKNKAEKEAAEKD